MKAEEKESTPVWICPNGHWSRVEYLSADGLFTPATCPICQVEMTLGRKDLRPMMQGYPREYTIAYNTEHRKGKRNNAKTNRR